MSAALRPWDDDEVAVLAHCVSVGAAPEHAADLLGITGREYKEACALFDIRRAPPSPGDRLCLFCGGNFSSADRHALRVCNPCKDTDEWQNVTPWVR